MLNLGDKPATRSITVLAAAVFAALQSAESMGAVPPGTIQGLAAVAKGLAMLGVAYGLRRAVAANGLEPVLRTIDAIADKEAPE